MTTKIFDASRVNVFEWTGKIERLISLGIGGCIIGSHGCLVDVFVDRIGNEAPPLVG